MEFCKQCRNDEHADEGGRGYAIFDCVKCQSTSTAHVSLTLHPPLLTTLHDLCPGPEQSPLREPELTQAKQET